MCILLLLLLLLLLYRMQLPLYLIFPVFPRDRRLKVRIFDDDDEDVRLGIFELEGRDRESEAHRVTSGPYIYTPWLLLLLLSRCPFCIDVFMIYGKRRIAQILGCLLLLLLFVCEKGKKKEKRISSAQSLLMSGSRKVVNRRFATVPESKRDSIKKNTRQREREREGF